MSEKNENKNEKYKSTSRRRLALIIVLIIIIIILLLKSCECNKTPSGNKPIDLDPNQQEVVENDDKEKNVNYKHTKIVMPGWGTIRIPKDTTSISSGINFYNPEKNIWYECSDCGSQLDENYICTNPECHKEWTKDTAIKNCYYMSFALYLEENNEMLYQSGLVEPNNRINNIEIAKPLPSGEYAAYVFIQPYKSDKATPTNSGKVNVKLIAQ